MFCADRAADPAAAADGGLMALAAGRLRHRVEIEEQISERDSDGKRRGLDKRSGGYRAGCGGRIRSGATLNRGIFRS